MRAFLILLVISALTTSGAVAQIIPIPDLDNSIVTWAYEGGETLVLLAVPDGSGRPFTEAFLPGSAELGTQVTDGTIMLQVRDNLDQPVENFPFEDLWLEASEGSLVSCPGGTCADVSTDEEGRTFWAAPIQAGGNSLDRLRVMINGTAATGDGVRMHIKSPDLTANLVVDLADVSLFAADFAAGYVYRSDFNNDGVLNLVDLGYLAAALGANCP